MTHYLTPDEIQIVIAANGAKSVELPFMYQNGELASVAFCGKCGRIVCHPECRGGMSTWTDPDTGEER